MRFLLVGVLASALATGCAHRVDPEEARLTVFARDGTELYPLINAVIVLSCEREPAETRRVDAHGRAVFVVPRGRLCRLSGTWREEAFEHEFVAVKAKQSFVMVSFFAFILHGVPFEPKINGERIVSNLLRGLSPN